MLFRSMLHVDYDTLELANKLKKKLNYDSSAFYSTLFTEENIKNGKVDPTFAYDNVINYDKLFEIQKEYSWLNRLAKKLSVPCLNRSWAGGSIQSFQYYHMQDRFSGEITDNDLIIVGMTSLSRWFYLSEGGQEKHALFGFFTHQWETKNLYDSMVSTFGSNMPFQVWNTKIGRAHV